MGSRTHRYNWKREKVDNLARSGSNETFIDPEPSIPVSISKKWEKKNTARQTRNSVTPSIYLSLISRHNLKRLTEVLTCHNK